MEGAGRGQKAMAIVALSDLEGAAAEAIRSLSAPLIGTEAPFNYNPPVDLIPPLLRFPARLPLASFPSLQETIRLPSFYFSMALVYR